MWNRKWTYQELVLFSRKLGQLLDVGFGLISALEMIQQSCTKRMKRDIQTLLNHLELGQPFSSGLQKIYFPSFYCFLILAAEHHGRYTEALFVLDQYYEQRKKRRKKYKKVLAYPLLVILTCLLTFLFLVHALIPQFSTLYGSFSLQLPWITQNLLLLSEQWKNIYLVLLITLCLTVLLLYFALKRYRLDCERMILKVPFFSSTLKTYLTAMIMKQMGYLLDSGIHILQVCDLFSQESHWLLVCRSFEQIKKELFKGTTLSQAFKQAPFLHPIAVEVISIFEQTGTISSGMIHMSKQLEEEYDHQLEWFTTILEANTVVGAGIIVLFVMLALFLPLFDFIQQI